MAKTYAQQLEEVQIAIGRIEGGAQSYSIGSRSLTRSNLKDLYDRENFLKKMVDREENGGLVIKYAVPE